MTMPKKFSFRVTKGGRVIIPRKIVKNEWEKNPGEFVELMDTSLRRAKMHRRALFRVVQGAIYTIPPALALGFAGNTLFDIFSQHRNASQEHRRRVLDGLFGARESNPETGVFPATHHPFQPLPEGKHAYDIELQCAHSYLNCFYPSYIITEEKDLKSIKNTSNVVAFGSQVSNVVTRTLMGNPFVNSSDVVKEIPLFEKDEKTPKRFVRLRWNLFSDQNAPDQFRRQYDAIWKYKPQIICDFDKKNPIYPKNDDDHDILFVTSMPRNLTTNARTIVFSGLHGPGTKAANLILNSPPLEELEKLNDIIGNNPHYQALFDVEKTPLGEPLRIKLRDAQALHLENA